MRRANGDGTIVKMTGNRRKPYAIRKVVGWKEDGRPILKYISYHKTKREAERALNIYNEDPYTIDKSTLKDVYEEWYALREKEKAENTLINYRGTWKHLTPLHDVRIQSIDRFELKRYFDNLEQTEIVLSRIKSMLKMLFHYAVKRGILPTSALHLHDTINMTPKKESRVNPHDVFKKEEIESLWQRKDDEMVRIVLVYIYTGLRYAELRKLIPKNIHEDYFDIKQSKTEAGNRIVPLSDKVKSLLPIKEVPPHSTFMSYMQQISPGHTPHDTRHTFISLMTEAGVDERIIQAIVGHKPTNITEHYTHISLETMLEAVNRI